MGLGIEARENLEKELAKNTEVLENLFTSFNLKLEDIMYSSIPRGCVYAYIEFSTLDGSSMIRSEVSLIQFKINFYKNKKLLYSNAASYLVSSFNGYEIIKIPTDLVNLIEYATSARIFITD